MENVDWATEDPRVKEACDLIAKAHNIYKQLSPELKERIDALMDIIMPMDETGV